MGPRPDWWARIFGVLIGSGGPSAAAHAVNCTSARPAIQHVRLPTISARPWLRSVSLLLLCVLFLARTVHAGSPCQAGRAAWQTTPVALQSGTFTAEFDATPDTAFMDGVIGLASGPANAYTDLAAIVRFNSAGNIDARNGGTYTADTTVPYTVGTRYHFRLVINLPTHTYDIHVTPEGSPEKVIGTSYRFRTEQDTVGRLDTWAQYASAGSHHVCNFTVNASGTWADYRVRLTMRSEDDDALGVMFRYQDNDNSYRFSWDSERTYRRLVKREDGVFTLLAEDAVPYVVGQTYQVEIIARGPQLEVWIDGARIFTVTDTSLARGTIALYAWANEGSVFDDVVVEELATGSVFLVDDFTDGRFTGWTIIDEGMIYGPSVWSAATEALVQRSNINTTIDAGDIARPGTYALYTAGGE